MNMCELIVKKKRGGRLNEKEIDWIVQGYTAGEIPDYQMSAMSVSYTHLTLPTILRV